jgi:hypothetical protein
MKFSSRVLIVSFALLLTRTSLTQSKPAPGWSEPKYFGIVLGKSTKAETIRRLGKPDYDGPEIESNAPIIEFHVDKPVIGKLYIYLKRSTVVGMYLVPDFHFYEDD